MLLLDLYHYAVQTQAACTPGTMCTVSCTDQNAICPASAFNAIAAAFATEGYWVQDDIIHYLVDTGMGLWAPLLYVIAAFGGLVSLAMGAPPRMYMWFFMGPAIYSWLLETRQPVTGVEWRVGDQPQDQTEVWKLAETGLRNSGGIRDPLGIHYNLPVYKDKPPGATAGVGGRLPPIGTEWNNLSKYANVSTFFLWFDELISDTVQQMTLWFGAYDQEDNPSAGIETNLIRKPTTRPQDNKWYLLSNQKWQMLTNITDAKAHSAELRDAFVTFLSSECGDLLKRSIDSARMIAVANAKGQNIDFDTTVMLKDSSGDPYNFATQILMSQTIPTPRSLRKLLSDDSHGSFREFANFLSGPGGISGWGVNDKVACDQFLYLLIHAFRWEAGHTTNQLIAAGPNHILPSGMIWGLFYGWDLRDWRGLVGPPAPGSPLTFEGQFKFLENMILVHLIRNEMAIAPAITDQRYATSEKSINYTLAYQRSVGQKSKFGEVYTWAMMIPYLQGVLLYLLAVAYPFACIIILVPGMHKAIFTWMSFWAWVKLWDLGFAIVLVLERSIWAMIGNNANASRLLGLVEQMADWGWMQINCTSSGGGILPDGGDGIAACSVPQVINVDPTAGVGHMQSWLNAMKTFDRALVLGANLDFDLANSYYIYIMSALYFAVPTITGQLVLGARAGAAGMINTAIGGVSQEAGKFAGSSFGSEGVTQMSANLQSVSQGAYAKSMRQSGLGLQAIEYGNQGMREDMAGGALGTAASNIPLMVDNIAGSRQSLEQSLEAAASHAPVLGAGLKAAGSAVTGTRAGGFANGLSGAASTFFGGSNAVSSMIDSLSGNAGGGGADPGAPAGRVGGGDDSSGRSGTGQTDTTPSNSVGSGSVGSGSTPHGENPGGQVQTRSPTLTGSSNASPSAPSGRGNSGTPGGPQTPGRPGAPTAAQAANTGAAALDMAVKPLVAAARNQAWQNQLGDISNQNGIRGDMNVAGFGHGQYGKGYGAAASRMGGYAGFNAEMDAWDARNQFANQITGNAVALGHFAGGMNPGNKPVMGAEAMAMDGMLGSRAKSAAGWVMPNQRGGFFDNAAGTTAQLQQSYGGDRIRSMFNSSTPTQAAAYAFRAEGALIAGTLSGGNTHGAGRTGGQIFNDTQGGRVATGSAGDVGGGPSLTSGSWSGANRAQGVSGGNPIADIVGSTQK